MTAMVTFVSREDGYARRGVSAARTRDFVAMG